MKYPQIKDICDFGYYAFGKSRIAYEFTGFMLLANNILLIGFHILTGAKILNTLSDHSLCTVIFSVIVTIIGIIFSIPRTLRHVSFMSMGSGMDFVGFITRATLISSSCMHGNRYSPVPCFLWNRERARYWLQWNIRTSVCVFVECLN